MPMKRLIPEVSLERYLVREVKHRGGLSRKFVSPSQKGVPDRIVIWPENRVHFVELKTDKGQSTALQAFEQERLSNLGCNVFVLKGRKAIDDYLQEAAPCSD